jgi:pilus assembly protein CpaC
MSRVVVQTFFGLAIALLTLTLQANTAELSSPTAGRTTDATVQHIVVAVNKSRTIHLARPFASTMIGSSDIIDVLPLSDRSLYVLGKKIGTTNLSILDEMNKLESVVDVEVTVDTANLQAKIQSSIGTRGIRVSSTDGQVILTGQAPDAVAADRAVLLAKSISPNGVINAMSVASSQQVLLKVRFLEASRDAGRELGVNWFVGNKNGTRGINTGNGALEISSVPVIGPATSSIPVFQTAGTLIGTANQPFGVGLANLVNKGQTVDVLISALETQGLIRRLAEPNLMALSGDTARFLAGGEFPVPIAATGTNGFVTPTIEYKPFGVRLSFTPTVLSNGAINLRIAPEVSELDFANSVSISGTSVPSLIKRDALTTVELRDGQSFAIAGLLQENDFRGRSQIPWLGSVPVLGPLLSSVAYQKHETDLVIIVTPHLVQPARPGQQLASPLDGRLPSNDPDFFLFSQSEIPKPKTDFAVDKPIGPYGHMLRVGPDSTQPGVN